MHPGGGGGVSRGPTDHKVQQLVMNVEFKMS